LGDSGRNILRRPLANRIQGLALALQMLRVGLVLVQLVGMVEGAIAVAVAVAGVVDVVVEEAGGLGGLRGGGLVDRRETDSQTATYIIGVAAGKTQTRGADTHCGGWTGGGGGGDA
jgi:glycogen synthase